MQKLFALYCLLAVALAAACNNSEANNKANTPNAKQQKAKALVELFTSEGCSSCPPADKLLSRIKTAGEAIVLSYHVDYWDHLGWKDAFSQAAFSERQRQYAQQFSLESIYTPQMIVNGQEEFVGSDEQRLRASLAKNDLQPAGFVAKVVSTNNRTVQLNYTLNDPSSVSLNVALVQTGATTVVKKGENEGRTLEHVNVVRELKTIEPQTTGAVEMNLPSGVAKNALSFVVFTQDKNSHKINGVLLIDMPFYQTQEN